MAHEEYIEQRWGGWWLSSALAGRPTVRHSQHRRTAVAAAVAVVAVGHMSVRCSHMHMCFVLSVVVSGMAMVGMVPVAGGVMSGRWMVDRRRPNPVHRRNSAETAAGAAADRRRRNKYTPMTARWRQPEAAAHSIDSSVDNSWMLNQLSMDSMDMLSWHMRLTVSDMCWIALRFVDMVMHPSWWSVPVSMIGVPVAAAVAGTQMRVGQKDRQMARKLMQTAQADTRMTHAENRIAGEMMAVVPRNLTVTAARMMSVAAGRPMVAARHMRMAAEAETAEAADRAHTETNAAAAVAAGHTVHSSVALFQAAGLSTAGQWVQTNMAAVVAAAVGGVAPDHIGRMLSAVKLVVAAVIVLDSPALDSDTGPRVWAVIDQHRRRHRVGVASDCATASDDEESASDCDDDRSDEAASETDYDDCHGDHHRNSARPNEADPTAARTKSPNESHPAAAAAVAQIHLDGVTDSMDGAAGVVVDSMVCVRVPSVAHFPGVPVPVDPNRVR